ncbi:MAG: radical SAM family heme chaperone HemW [bacterium]
MNTLPTGLYIHLPWCEKKCPYCDFNSHPQRGELPFALYVEALLADARYEAELTHVGEISSVFIGGGTPSLIPATDFETLMKGLRNIFTFNDSVEVTMEANPGSAEQSRFRAYHECGVNRLSLGIQSFSDSALLKLGRIHDSKMAFAAIDKAREAGIERINLDLMFALPEQQLSQAIEDIKTAIDLRPEHISHYQLTLEPHTAFHRQPPPLPGDDLAWDMQEHCQQLLSEHGYQHYEVSAYARAKEQCLHNLNYWQFGDYIGIGAGAHGKRTSEGKITRSIKYPHPNEYMQKARTGQFDLKRHQVSDQELGFEFMLNALRLVQGVPGEFFKQRTGLDYAKISNTIKQLQVDGLLLNEEKRIQTTELGQRFLNDVLERFL